MIQCSSERFSVGHSDHIYTASTFNLTDIGECKIQVFPYQDDTNPPTVYIVSDWGIVCGIRLDAPLFWGREYKFTNVQKKKINDAVNHMYPRDPFPPGKVWWDILMMWKGMNDRLEKFGLPEDPPDYTKLP